MNKSFLIVPEVKRMDLPLFQLKKTICKQRTTLHKKIITDQGIQNPIVTYLYSNHLDSIFPINQFLQIVDSNLEVLHPGRHHQKLGNHHLLNKRVNLYHCCFMTHLQEIHLHLHHNKIYMEQPEGFVVNGKEKKVCQLRKAIYGLKQAALQWNKQLHKSLLEMGFIRCKSDPGTYFKIVREEIIILLIYVDDALFMGSNKIQVLSHKKDFMKQWESTNLGPAEEYLGMRITRDRKKHTITLDQTHYAEKVIRCFGQENCKEVSVPLPTRYNLRPNQD